MKDNLELHSRDKKVHKMTREGLVEENLSQGTGKRISDRVLDAKLDRPVDREMNFSAGRVDVPSGTGKKNRLYQRQQATLEEEQNAAKSEQAPIETSPSPSISIQDNPEQVIDVSTLAGDYMAAAVGSTVGRGSVKRDVPVVLEPGETAGNTQTRSGKEATIKSRKMQQLEARSEAANARLEQAQGQLPKKKVVKHQRLFDEETGKAIVSNYQWTGQKQNLLIFSDFAQMKELAQAAKEMPLLDATHPEFLNHDEITVRAADRSNFDGMIVFASEDGKVLLGRQENYDNRGHYDNHDRSMLYLSDDSKVYGLLCGDGFVKTKAECLAGGIFSTETFAEFDRLKQTVLTQFNQTKEQFFGEPVTDAALKIGFDNYLEMHVASDGSWDYTLYDAQYLEIDGGQIGDADMSYDTATEEILKSHGLGTKTVKPMDMEELENATRFAEAKRLYDQGFVYDDYVLRTAVSVEMEEAMDAKFVCHEDFTDEQKEILYAAANKKLPYDVMLNPEFTAEHMQFLSEMMEKGYDVEAVYVAGKQISLADHPMQVSEIADVKRQMEYDNIPKMLYTNEQWKEIQEGMRKQLDVSVYAKKEFSPEQMTELRRGLLKGIDVTAYADPAYDAQQMRFLRRGLESGFDVSIYNNPAIPASDMKSLYFALRDGTKVPGLMETNACADKSSLTTDEGEKTVFRYYSTQRPIMPGSYPNGENKPISITNFDTREPIGAGTMQAWGYLEYVQPLTEKQLSDYELRKPPVQHFKKEQAAIACPAKEVEVDHGKKTSVMDNLRKKQALISGQAKPELMPNKRKAVIE